MFFHRPSELNSIKSENYSTFDSAREVFKDFRPFENNISIETIFDKCNICFEPNPKNSIMDIINDSGKSKTFGCRFKIVKCGSRKFKLVPLNDDTINYPNTPTHHQNRLCKLKLTRTPGSENMYAVKQITPDRKNVYTKKNTSPLFVDENCNTPQRKSKLRINESDNNEIPVKRRLLENGFNKTEKEMCENPPSNM